MLQRISTAAHPCANVCLLGRCAALHLWHVASG
jgi:hypothetical protein